MFSLGARHFANFLFFLVSQLGCFTKWKIIFNAKHIESHHATFEEVEYQGPPSNGKDILEYFTQD